ncbi:hypothetical protein BDZ89DRAFT_1189772 [Hymenopellis radicata]|nr:hypothetical protein BDZ89DRAFT_1189772 [Hymenopellis radicata]
MTNKEERQSRNKISARNLRSETRIHQPPELDIAERDRLLTAIRSELGSTQSENQALRREIAALENAFLGGRPAKQEESPMLSSPSLFSALISSPKDILSSQLSMYVNPASAPQPATANVKPQGFDGFADGNTFTLKNLFSDSRWITDTDSRWITDTITAIDSLDTATPATSRVPLTQRRLVQHTGDIYLQPFASTPPTDV